MNGHMNCNKWARLLVKIRQIGTKIVQVLSKNELLLFVVASIIMLLTVVSAFLIIWSLLYSYALLFLGIVVLLISWIGWALIGIVQDEEDFYF